MSTKFSNLIYQMREISVEEFIGYEKSEILEIEEVYDIKVKGDFWNFLSIAGRSSGGAIGDSEVVLYRGYCNRKDHVLFQESCREELLGKGLYDLVKMKPFFISVEGEAYYYFFTTLDGKDVLYVQDDNNDNKVEKTEFSFVSYMERQLHHELRIREKQQSPSYTFSRNVIVCKGDLLKE